MKSARDMPHHAEAERSVLGACLLRPELAGAIDLADGDWYAPAHAAIWRAMRSLADRGQPVDETTLEAELRTAGTLAMSGGLPYLADLHASVPTAENVGHYVGLLRATARLRALILACSEVASEARTQCGDPGAFLADAEARLFAATAHAAEAGRGLREVLAGVLADVEARAAQGGRRGLPSGLPDLDQRTHGWQPGNLVVLAARPSVGKTTLATQWAIEAARAGAPVLMCSLEQSAPEIGERAVVSDGRLDAGAVGRGALDADAWARLHAQAASLASLAVEIDDGAALTSRQIRSRARRFATRHRGLHGLIVVDYLQLVRPAERYGNREQEVASVSRDLKALAKELRWTVIALSQLRRKASEDDEPTLSDLRESGAIEQDADLVAFLHREKTRGVTRLILAKHRNGAVGRCDLVFVTRHVRFENATTGLAGALIDRKGAAAGEEWEESRWSQ